MKWFESARKNFCQLQNEICTKEMMITGRLDAQSLSVLTSRDSFLNCDPMFVVVVVIHTSLIKSLETNGILHRTTCPTWVDSKTWH